LTAFRIAASEKLTDTYLDTRYPQPTGPNGPFLLPPRCLLTAGYPASAVRYSLVSAAPLNDPDRVRCRSGSPDRLHHCGRFGPRCWPQLRPEAG